MNHTCPVCGYPDLETGPTIGNDHSYGICPCCGFHFGVDDMDAGYTYITWREKWANEGMLWWSTSNKAPSDWNPRKQLLNIGVVV